MTKRPNHAKDCNLFPLSRHSLFGIYKLVSINTCIDISRTERVLEDEEYLDTMAISMVD